MGIVRRSRRVQSAAAVRASWFPKPSEGIGCTVRMVNEIREELDARLRGWTLTREQGKDLLAVCKEAIARVTKPKEVDASLQEYLKRGPR